ncbi:MAG: M23 family metallopeptidase [Bacteroidales bacterium]
MSKFKLFIGIVAMAMAISTANAEGLSFVAKHDTVHNALIASQMNIQDQIRLVDTQQYMNAMIHDEKFGRETYTIGWDSPNINPYVGMDVPDTKKLDVSNYALPCKGYVTSNYGYRARFRRMHHGIDLKVYTGDTIYAAFDGKVRLRRYQRNGYGYYLVLRHSNQMETVYGHLSKFLVDKDQEVKVGDPIALGGNTGRSTGSHLHFETRFMGYAINPSAIFDFANGTTHTDIYYFDKRTYTKARNYAPSKSEVVDNKYKETAKGVSYRVRKGDTLSKIASKHYVTVSQICNMNGISSKSPLAIGQVLRIK